MTQIQTIIETERSWFIPAIKSALTTLAVLAFVGGLFVAALLYTLRVPEVEVTFITKECVRVVPSYAGDCNNLPPKYNIVHVARFR